MTIIEMIRFSLLRIKRHKENIYFKCLFYTLKYTLFAFSSIREVVSP